MRLNGAASANEEPFLCGRMMAARFRPFHGHVSGWMHVPHNTERDAITRAISVASTCLGCAGCRTKLQKLVERTLVRVDFGVDFGRFPTLFRQQPKRSEEVVRFIEVAKNAKPLPTLPLSRLTRKSSGILHLLEVTSTAVEPLFRSSACDGCGQYCGFWPEAHAR